MIAYFGWITLGWYRSCCWTRWMTLQMDDRIKYKNYAPRNTHNPEKKSPMKRCVSFSILFFRHRCYFIIIHPFCLLSMIYPFCENLNTTTTFPCISSLDPLIAFSKLKSPVFLFLQNRLSSLTLAQKIYVCRNQLSNMWSYVNFKLQYFN